MPCVGINAETTGSKGVDGRCARLLKETATEADQRGLLVAVEMAEVLSSMRESGQQGRRGFTGPFGVKVKLNLLSRTLYEARNFLQGVDPKASTKQGFDEEYTFQSVCIELIKQSG